MIVYNYTVKFDLEFTQLQDLQQDYFAVKHFIVAYIF